MTTAKEIKCRGKIINSFIAGQWHYGYYVKTNRNGITRHYICSIDEADYEVDPKTVGEFTGAVDIDGKEIYDGDIVKSDRHTLTVEWRAGWLGFRLVGEGFNFLLNQLFMENFKIIGNKFDNPELLNNGENNERN